MLALTMAKCIVSFLGMATNVSSFLHKAKVAEYKTMFLPFYVYYFLHLRSKSLKNTCKGASLYQNWFPLQLSSKVLEKIYQAVSFTEHFSAAASEWYKLDALSKAA